VALALLAEGLTPGNTDLLDTLRTPGRWDVKKGGVLDAVRQRAEDTVVLIDDPFAAAMPGPVFQSFGQRVAELTQDLLDIDGLRLVFTASDWNVPRERLHLQVRSDPDEILNPEQWNGEAQSAERLRQQPLDKLRQLSPLELRLRVALIHLGVRPEEAVRRRALGATLSLLIRRLGPRGGELRAILERLSVLRIPVPPGALEHFGADGLEPELRRLLEVAVLFGNEHELRLHSDLAAEMRRGLTADGERDAHNHAAEYYRMQFGEEGAGHDHVPTVRHELECLHHRAEAGDEDLLQEDTLWFTDQYVGLGRALSLARRRGEAVVAYERALDLEDDNAYAHHYLAWNLDVEAADHLRSETHYRRAVDLDPSHAWYQGRFISFLITRGRSLEARARWDEALAEIYTVFSPSDFRIQEVLHAQIARLLLHRGQLGFASEVLEDISIDGDEPAWLRAERRLLRALQEAEQERLVWPARVPEEHRTRPVLFEPAEVPPGAVWMPGRIASLDDDFCHVRVLRCEQEEERFAWLHLPIDRFIDAITGHKAMPPAGTFVEIIEFEDGELTISRHPREPFFDDALPRLFPWPDRYMRNRGAA